MKAIIILLKQKINFSNFWVKTGLIVITLSIFANHLSKPENFPLHKSYKFPWFPIVVSILLAGIALIIAYFNFNYFKRRHLVEKVTVHLIFRFLFTTLGYISIVYILFYFTLNGLINGINSYNLYGLLTGYSISMLSCTIVITLLFATDIYRLHKFASIQGKLKVEHAGKITLVGYDEIAFFYSENKIVYIIKTDGTSIVTDFTLNEVEPKISEQSFFRANRQTILHARSIEQVQSIENGKLQVLLKPTLFDKNAFQITISRYKKQAFMDWFENKM
ncbi:LytR/AlgR family response regulator transcription factor [Spongiivirga citrea]|uniref:LytTR family transcriptional regulator n=1 Tax=Spongiivirga citrea TaxID=1481457 RepID=A0A6M0CI26_9FLAO|nr:LytTR family DNA-binding domain-containing protein [Spongiivirga citrea]NER17616.1 LytTR family transcriptional regulator [Spongiivirga citrea]